MKRPNRMSKTNHRSSLNLVTLLLHAHAAAATSNLRNDIFAVVPACAQQCVLSFLSVNFDAGSMDGMGVTLDSICATDSRSGFTLGEGAMQCLTAEKSVGSCSEQEADGTYLTSPVRQRCCDPVADFVFCFSQRQRCAKCIESAMADQTPLSLRTASLPPH